MFPEELTNEEIQKRLDFANKLLNRLEQHGKPRVLAPHLQLELELLSAEVLRRVSSGGGAGI